MTKQIQGQERTETETETETGFNPDVVQEDDPTTLCVLDNDVGPCRSQFTRYYFDRDMVKCLPFTYGGCQGNANNFVTEDSCMDTCFMAMKKAMMAQQTNTGESEQGGTQPATGGRKKKKHNGMV